MRIFIDGDACPQKEEILEVARKYHKEVHLFIDFAHQVDDDLYDKVVYCDIGNDSVDMQIIKRIHKHDLLITQDYGLASLALSKNVFVLHISGLVIDLSNIDRLLFRRYGSSKLRKANKRVKGPSARSNELKKFFIDQLEKLIRENG